MSKTETSRIDKSFRRSSQRRIPIQRKRSGDKTEPIKTEAERSGGKTETNRSLISNGAPPTKTELSDVPCPHRNGALAVSSIPVRSPPRRSSHQDERRATTETGVLTETKPHRDAGKTEFDLYLLPCLPPLSKRSHSPSIHTRPFPLSTPTHSFAPAPLVKYLRYS